MNCIPDIHDVIILLSICQLSLLATGYCNEYSFDMNTYNHKSPNNNKKWTIYLRRIATQLYVKECQNDELLTVR